ncbi:hypothetical protein BHM03_00033074 [Ensete ventricosum]|uniref:Uncharacterized protein n=1 Tax=Ensete ventricosum TaxID=4639 RepID=A0A445MIT5_ENSVE|nr:hypothetical protein BHM03_00033074 [Ensete ventricosum]
MLSSELLITWGYCSLYQVIQDISFSDDSKWIVISSSRGTSHLFAICPSGGAADLKFNESNFANVHYGSAWTTKMSVHLSQNSCSSKISEQSLYVPGSPVTLSAVCRIKNGKPGFKSTVNGLAAAGTGKISPLPGAIASVFHYCKGTGLNANIGSLRKMYYFLVFFPSGSIIQYVLHQSSREYCGIDQSEISSIAHESSHEAYSRSDVEAVQKWDVCHKRNRKDGCNNVDIYGDHGRGENSKFLCKDKRKEISAYNSASGVDLKTKLPVKQTPHLYISEFELQVHEAWVPLWSKSKSSHSQVGLGANLLFFLLGVAAMDLMRIPWFWHSGRLKISEAGGLSTLHGLSELQGLLEAEREDRMLLTTATNSSGVLLLANSGPKSKAVAES